MNRVIVCGSRNVDPGKARSVICARLAELPGTVTIVHGAARGVDRIAGQEAEKLGLLLDVFPADWERDGKAAGFIRNQKMVDAGADLVLAFWDGSSAGTQHTITRAGEAGIPVEVIAL